MDDDYNVISGGLGVVGDGEELQYPDDDGDNGLAVVGGNVEINDENEYRRDQVFDALETSGTRKRRFEEEDIEEVYDEYGNRSHPVDWFMRMPVGSEDLEDRQKQNAAKRRALEELEMKINEAIQIDEQKLTENGNDDQNDGFGGETVSELCDSEMRRRYGRKKEVMMYPPSDGSPWMGISDSRAGQRFYVRMFRDERKFQVSLVQSLTKQITRSNLGYKAFQKVMSEAEELKFKKQQTKNIDREEELERMMNVDSMAMELDVDKFGIESSLWVNKYDARNFAELLSDDTVNRNILTWLKLWDECVFKKKVDNLIDSLNERDKEVMQMDNGKIRRPHFKMIMLSGPAGLGKTTLARVVAKQAGYSCVDVNASDARTVADLNRVLEGAVKTSRTLDADQRPCCLILDEIDGAPIDTIRHLIRCLQAVGKKAIRRPIIGICNNLFAPALRELRNVAWCVQLGTTKQEKLAARLQQICEAENLRCDLTTLRKLCEMCANDMRHTINTLQWVAVASRKTKRMIGMRLIQEVMEKEKSGAASIFEHWSAILELGKHVDGRGGAKTMSERVYHIQRIAADHGGEDRFVAGLHTNYLVTLPVGQLRKAAMLFLFYDDIQKIIHSLQNWSVQKYAFVFYVSLHLTIATHARVKIAYPQLEQNSNAKLKESEETLSAVRSGGVVAKRSAKKDLLLDILPLLVGIVQPPIKPMNESLYTPREIAVLNSMVSSMVDYGLTYSATMVKDQINWLFAPSIDVLTMFPISEDKRRNVLPNATRQLIAHKITLLKVNLMDSEHAPITNTAKIKQIIEKNSKDEKKKEKRLSAGAMTRIRNRKLADVVFTYEDGDSSAVKKKITVNEIENLIFSNT